MSGRKRKQHLTTLQDVEPIEDNSSILQGVKFQGSLIMAGVGSLTKKDKENIRLRKKVQSSDSDTDDEDMWRSLKAKGVKVSCKGLKSEARKQLFTDASQHNVNPISKIRKRNYPSSPDTLNGSNSSVSDEKSKENNSKESPRSSYIPVKRSKMDDELCDKLCESETKSCDQSGVKDLKLICKINRNYEKLFEADDKKVHYASTKTTRKPSISVIGSLQCEDTSMLLKSPECETEKTRLENARTSLHASSVPSSLPCRDAEYQNILNFVERKVCSRVGGCMYISGVPGTGKTATVTHVISHLQLAASKGELPKFNSVEINGMRLSDPRQAYVQLYQKMFRKKDRISADVALKKLEAYFNKNDNEKITTVVIVDELDLLCTRKQEVVYNLLEWPSKPNSRLVVLTIANTMDMPERKLKGKINSRLGLTRLTFLPYTHKQLEEIVLNRLAGNEAFVIDAVRLATRKVAAVSGDCRRALEICRRAAQLPAHGEPVRITHIEKAIKEMTNSNVACHIRGCSKMEKTFLRAVSDVCLRTGVDEVILEDVASQMISTCLLERYLTPTMPALLELCQRLRCHRILFTNDYRAGLMQRITLNVSQDDLYYGLKDDDCK